MSRSPEASRTRPALAATVSSDGASPTTPISSISIGLVPGARGSSPRNRNGLAMSSASEPPYPPGGQARPAALPARQARALPAAPRPDEAGGNEVDDATIPRSAVQRGAS